MRLASFTLLAVSAALLSALGAGSSQPAGGPPAATAGPSEGLRAPEREALEVRLQEILDRPDFRRAMRGGGHDPRNVGQWLLLRLRRFLGRLGGLHETNYALFLIAVVVGSVLLIAILAHIAYTLLQAFRPLRRRRPDGSRPARTTAQDPSSLVRRADELAAAGDYRSAVRHLYLALVRSLQMNGVLPRTPSQTNREHLRHLAGRPTLAAVVQPFTHTFDEKWYGGRPADTTDVERCRRWLEEALREVETQ
jgi:hypothetical protein